MPSNIRASTASENKKATDARKSRTRREKRALDDVQSPSTRPDVAEAAQLISRLAIDADSDVGTEGDDARHPVVAREGEWIECEQEVSKAWPPKPSWLKMDVI